MAELYESDNVNGDFVLTLDLQAPTLEEVAVVEVEVKEDALSQAIKAVKATVRTNNRLRIDSKKVQANKEVESE